MSSLKIKVFKEINDLCQLIVPKELENRRSIFRFTLNNSKKNIIAYVDNQKNLWYMDFYSIDKTDKPYNGFVKISGLYERKDMFLIDTISELNKVSTKHYKKNTEKDNEYLQNIYDNILSKYYLYIKKNKL